MSHSNVASINESVQKTQIWLKELVETGVFENENQAYSGLRAVLHTLRDRLPVNEAVHLASELPMVVRGFYYEGWKPASVPVKIRTPAEFDEAVRVRLLHGGDFDVRAAIRTVLQLLDRRVSGGEIRQIRETLPAELRQLWPAPSAEPVAAR